MKIAKRLLIIAATVVMLCVISVVASAATYGDLTYDVSDGEAYIYDCSTSVTEVEIPAEIDGYPVTRIDDYTFSDNDSITSVIIPDSVTTIGDCAFQSCGSLAEITIPDSVTSIGGSAFQNCDSITSITIPNSVTSIASYTFSYCRSLTEITIPDSVTIIGIDAFYGTAYYNDDSNWENDALYIGKHLIAVENVTHYEIKDGTLTISDSAFRNNTKLVEVTIPGSITSIEGSFFGCKRLKKVTILDGVTSIGYRVFENCTSLAEITIPDSVTSIGRYAFYNTAYYNDESNWENGVLYIGKYLISANNITECKIKDGTVTIADGAFYQRISLESITIPDSVTTIGNEAFRNCTALENITIPDSVVSIGDFAFSGCMDLTEVTIGKGVASIGNNIFSGCCYLESITVDENNEYFSSDEYGVLYNKDKTELIHYPLGISITKYTIPSSVTSIKDKSVGYGVNDYWSDEVIDGFIIYGIAGTAAETYANENGITFIAISSEDDIVPYISCEIIDGEVTITGFEISISGEIVIPDAIGGYPVTSIGGSAFGNYTSLTGITIPDSVTSIGDCAFGNCTSLTEITIPDSVTSISGFAFSYCTSLTEITIPDSVTSIGDGAFSYCTSLTEITIPDSVTSIGHGAFSYCTSLTEITMPDSVTSIGYSAFVYCESLTEITIPDSITSIVDGTFFCCESLAEIIIPDSVTSIGELAFGYYYDETIDEVCLVDGFTIYGYAGSAAETYAKENGIKFIAITSEEDVVIPDKPTPDKPIQDTSTVLVPNADSNITVTDAVASVTAENSVEDVIKSVENENVQILDKDGKELAKDALVGTGSKINILDKEGKVLSTYEVMVKSDVDGNGKITPADARLALRAAAGIDTISGVYATVANYDEKETISTSDARMILRKAAGLE